MVITNYDHILNKLFKTKGIEYAATFIYAAHAINLLI